MKVVAYVLNADGTPLMPCYKHGRVRRWLRDGRAKIVNHKPLTVRLSHQVDCQKPARLVLGIDPGRKNIGLCVINEEGKILFASDVLTRNIAICKLVLSRKRARQASRRGDRKNRQRRACKAYPELKKTEIYRILPGCRKTIRCKSIVNDEARFNARRKQTGKLVSVSAKHLLQTHLNLVRKICGLLPITDIVLEINKFDFARMENPNIRRWEYQKGRLFGYKSKEHYVSEQQKDICLLCGNRHIEHFHHIVQRSKNGSDIADNIAGLCTKCHDEVHKDKNRAEQLNAKKQGLLKKYHVLSVINQVIPFLLKELSDIRDTYVTTGYETYCTRKVFGLTKGHCVDAYCIALSALFEIRDADDIELNRYDIGQYRRHDRKRIQAQRERTYYLNGKKVCKNRHKRTGQKEPSLAEFRKGNPALVSKLTVKKSTRSYRNKNRVMPGTVFLYNGKRYVLRSTQSNGTKWYAEGQERYFPSSACTIVSQNTGLVFM